jgi:hypothetical protein
MLFAHIMGVPVEELLAPSTTAIATCALAILASRIATVRSRRSRRSRR